MRPPGVAPGVTKWEVNTHEQKVSVLLQRGQRCLRRRQGHHEEYSGRQGCRSGRDDCCRYAGSPGFTITTDACTQYYADGRQINDDITADIFEHLKGLEEITGKKFGDNTNPLLVSVRSGARQSMPGMMDTILNLGLNDEAVEGLAKKTGNARFAYDCYRRFVQMFADVVMMVPKSLFEVEIDKMKEAKGVKNDVDLTADDLKELVGVFKKIYEENEGKPFPQDPRDQLIELSRLCSAAGTTPVQTFTAR